MIFLPIALAADPVTREHAEVLVERGMVALDEGRVSDAREAALEAMSGPDVPWRAHWLYLMASERGGLAPVAGAEYQWRSEADPDAAAVWAWRQVETGQADPGEIAALARTSPRLAPLALAWTGFGDQQYEVTASLLGTIESADEAELSLRVNLVNGDWAAAARTLDDARKRFPDRPDVALGLWQVTTTPPKGLIKLQTDALAKLPEASTDARVLYRSRRVLITAQAPSSRVDAVTARLLGAGEPTPLVNRARWSMRVATQTGRAMALHPELASPFPALTQDERRPVLEAMAASLEDEGRAKDAARIVGERRAERDDFDVALLHARLLLSARDPAASKAATDALILASVGHRDDLGRLDAARQRQDLADALAVLGAATGGVGSIRWVSLASRLDVAGRWGRARESFAPASDPMSPDDLFVRANEALTKGDLAVAHRLAEDGLDRLCSLTAASFAQPGVDEKLARALVLLARSEQEAVALPYATIASLLAPSADSLLLEGRLLELRGEKTAAYVRFALAERYGATTARDRLRTYRGAADFDVPTATIALGWNPAPKAATSRKLPKPPRITESVPPYALETAEGTLTKDALKGKVVVLAFFASWCGPCKEELPELDAMAKRLSEAKIPAKVIAVSVDQSRGDYGRFVHSSGLQGLTFAWSPELGMDFRIRGIPALWLHDKEGVARMSTVGYGRGGVARLEQEIRSLAE